MRKQAINAVLLGFVALSLSYMAFRNSGVANQLGAVAVEASARDAGAKASDLRTRVVAYYFHVNVRCPTCRNIEAYSKEVVHSRFAKEISKGDLEWRLVNIEQPENRHYVQRYRLFTKSLVLVRFEKGEEVKFKVLNDTWELVGNKAAMQRYVEQEIQAFLRKTT